MATIFGTTGNDNAYLPQATLTYDGLAGYDIATITAKQTDFISITVDLTGVVTLTGASESATILNVEQINFDDGKMFVGSATANDAVTGAATNDKLWGLAGNDTLNGGAGADVMKGGTGNDIYVVDNAGDVVTELAAEGTDTVKSGVTYTLAANVENLTLTGATAINGTGNTLNNVLTGNGAANALTGLDGNDTLNGGAGADTMVGGTGNDVYFVGAAGDIVTELSGQGTDTVKSGITYTLTANVEKLILTGTAAINGTGNTLANAITGNSAANMLNGMSGNDTLIGGGGNDTLTGGAGKDGLTGGAGNDLFVFNAALSASTNIDTIKDYTAADTIQLENSIFTKLATVGALGTANFVVGTAAVDANDFIVYNNSTGALYYDADGSGAGAAVQFATVYASGTTPATLSAAEFVVI